MADPIINVSQLDLEDFSNWIEAGSNEVIPLTETEKGNNFLFKWRTTDKRVHVLYRRNNGRMSWSGYDAMMFVTTFLQGASAKVRSIRPGITLTQNTLVEGFADKLAKLRAEGVEPDGVVVVFFKDDGTTGIHWNAVHSALPTKAVLGITLAAVTNLIAED